MLRIDELYLFVNFGVMFHPIIYSSKGKILNELILYKDLENNTAVLKLPAELTTATFNGVYCSCFKKRLVLPSVQSLCSSRVFYTCHLKEGKTVLLKLSQKALLEDPINKVIMHNDAAK